MIATKSCSSILLGLLFFIKPSNAPVSQPELNNYYVEHYGKEAELLQNNVHSILTNRNSFLWSATGAEIVITQTKTITGKVYDMNGMPVAAATILSLPSGTETITDANGRFELVVPASDTTLKVTALNFELCEISISGKNIFSITLTSSVTNLQEIVLVGTRSAGRSKLNSPVPIDVFNISSLQLHAPQNDLNQLLQFVSP